MPTRRLPGPRLVHHQFMPPGKRRREQRGVRHGARDGPHRIQRIGQRLDADAADQAETRLVADHAAIRRGPDDGARGLRAERQRHHVIGDRRRRAGRGSARRVRDVMRIARLVRLHHREFGRHGLADDDAARRARERHARRIPRRTMTGIDRRAVGRRHIRGVDQILDAHRQAVQQPAAHPASAARACASAASRSIDIPTPARRSRARRCARGNRAPGLRR